MKKLTPWFDANSHAPTRDGWYDCKECNVRHFFNEGRWYRDKKSMRLGHVIVHKMHWRGLTRESLTILLTRFNPNSPRAGEEQAWLNMVPVGREFGSPDYDRLAAEDMKNVANINSLKAMFGRSEKRVSIQKMNEAIATRATAGSNVCGNTENQD